MIRPRTGGGVATGLLLAASFPPAPFPLLAFVALAPLAAELERLAREGAPSSSAVRPGLAAGLLSWALLLLWVPGALVESTPLLAAPLFLLLVALLGGVTAGVARLALALRLHGLPLVVGLPWAWLGGEWLRSAGGTGGVAWLPLGTALAPLPALVAPAAWIGVGGLSLWVAAVGTWAGVRVAGGPPVPRRGWALPVLLLLTPAWVGGVRVATLRSTPVLRVAALEAPLPGGGGRPVDEETVLALLLPLLAEAPWGGVDLILLPEGVIPSPVSPEGAGGGAVLQLLRSRAREGGKPILAGGYVNGAGAGGEEVFNAALLIAPDGSVGVAHAKRFLVPGVEGALPGLPDRWVAGPWRGGAGGLVPGAERGEVSVAGVLAAVLICYESAFGRALDPERRGPALALTHEGWFGDGWIRGWLPREQHIAHLQVRAVEARAGIMRAAARGEALHIDPSGRVLQRGVPGGAGWLLGSLEREGGAPPPPR